MKFKDNLDCVYCELNNWDYDEDCWNDWLDSDNYKGEPSTSTIKSISQ